MRQGEVIDATCPKCRSPLMRVKDNTLECAQPGCVGVIRFMLPLSMMQTWQVTAYLRYFPQAKKRKKP